MAHGYDGHSGDLSILDDEWRRQLGLPERPQGQRVPSRPRRNTNPEALWQQTPARGELGMSYMTAYGLIQQIKAHYGDRWCVFDNPVGWDARTWAVLIWPVSGEWRVLLPSVERFREYDQRRTRLGIDGPRPGGAA